MERIGDSGQKCDPRFRRKQSHIDHTLARSSSILLCCALFVCLPFGIEGRTESWDTSVHDTVAEELEKGMQPSIQEEKPSVRIERPSEKRNFSLHVSGAPAREVIRTLAEMTGRNLVFSGDLSETVTASLDHVTPEEALTSVLASCGLSSRTEGSTLIVFNSKLEKNAVPGTRAFRLSYADAEEVAEGLGKVMEKGKVTFSPSANTVIISGTPRELMQAESLVKALDVPEKQVKVEAEVVAVNKSYAKDLGIDWDFKSLTGSASYDRDSWSEQRYVTDDSGNILYDSDGNPRIRNIERNGWDVTIPEGYAGISYGRSLAGHPYTFFFQAKLNALVTRGKAKVLARPSVVTMNGRKAEILIGSRIPVIVEHMENGVKTTATEYKDAGIKLTYTPIISRNDDITADVHAEVATPYLVPEMKAYRIITRSANTMVRLKSGDMLTIGGLIDKEQAKTMRKVPILGDIPLLGRLFQSHSTSTEESEIVIVIKADIVREDIRR